MTSTDTIDLDLFSSGHLVVGSDRIIIFSNRYISDLTGLPQSSLAGTPLSKIVTKASGIFIDSYVYPMLILESTIQEVQLTWAGQHGARTPVVVSINLAQDGLSYWSVCACINRDKLQSAWLTANEALKMQSKKLSRLATTDPLTGLLNRRELHKQAKKIIHQSARSSSTFAVLSVDVDFFKVVNDTYGHQVGDTVLINLANILSNERRANDLAARTGGEEFVLILPDINKENSIVLAEKLRAATENSSVSNIKITISIGLVVSHKNTQVDLDTLLSLSDKALYDAKAAGRNRTVLSA